MHIVAHEGQVLKARTVIRLVRDQQFNPVEFNKIILPPHESEPNYQEPQEDRIALQELLRSFIMQQQSKMKIQDFKPSDQRFNVTVEHADSIITASPAEGANQRASAASTATSAQPLIIPHPPGLQIPQGIQSQPQQPVPSQPQVPQQAPPSSTSATSSGQKENQNKVKTSGSFRHFSGASGHQGKLSFSWSRSDQCRSSRSSIRRRVASRSHTSGMVLRGSSGIFSRSDQGSYHKRAQADWSSWP